MAVSITTSSLRNVASQLKNLSMQMRCIASDMATRVNSMSGWTDPRAQEFVGMTNQVKRGLDLHLSNFCRLAEFLEKYATNQEEAEREQKRRMQNLQ